MPEGMTSLPEGMKSLPEGLISLPEGMTSLPEGMITLPEGLISLPEGMTSLPAGMTSLPDATNLEGPCGRTGGDEPSDLAYVNFSVSTAFLHKASLQGNLQLAYYVVYGS